MNKLDEIVEALEDYLDSHIEGDCSICPFANMGDDGIIHCGYDVWYGEDELECGLDTKEKIKQKVIEAVKEILEDKNKKLEKALDRACEELAMFSGVDVTSPLATAVYKYQCENCKLKNVDCNINGSIDDENCMPSKSKLYWKQYLLKESET